jgi:FtsP/CotA-like multicopper oxidase with cupredoxin domain
MPNAGEYPPCIATPTATIAASGTTSGAVNLHGLTAVGLHMPAAFTGTSVTFTAAPTETGTYQAVCEMGDSGSTYTVTAAASKYIPLDPQVFAGVQHLKVVSGSSEAAERAIVIACRPV